MPPRRKPPGPTPPLYGDPHGPPKRFTGGFKTGGGFLGGKTPTGPPQGENGRPIPHGGGPTPPPGDETQGGGGGLKGGKRYTTDSFKSATKSARGMDLADLKAKIAETTADYKANPDHVTPDTMNALIAMRRILARKVTSKNKGDINSQLKGLYGDDASKYFSAFRSKAIASSPDLPKGGGKEHQGGGKLEGRRDAIKGGQDPFGNSGVRNKHQGRFQRGAHTIKGSHGKPGAKHRANQRFLIHHSGKNQLNRIHRKRKSRQNEVGASGSNSWG